MNPLAELVRSKGDKKLLDKIEFLKNLVQKVSRKKFQLKGIIAKLENEKLELEEQLGSNDDDWLVDLYHFCQECSLNYMPKCLYCYLRKYHEEIPQYRHKGS